MTKRAFDVFFSCVGLLLSLPVFLALVCCVRMRLGSPVFFTQERPGKDGLPFELIKFRTMRDAVDDHGELLPDAERLTDFGLWLRRTSLDARHHSSEFRQRMREINQRIKPYSKELLAQRLRPFTRRAQMPHHSAPVLAENCPNIINFWQSTHALSNQKRRENKG